MDAPKATTRSPRETKKLASFLSRSFRSGQVIALEGDLGSGKTTFVKGVLSAFKVKAKGESPTFVLVKPYKLPEPIRGIEQIIHIDAYRVESVDEALSAGITDFFGQKGNLCIVEWADRVKELIPLGAVWLIFRHGSGDTREIVWKGH